MLLRPDCLLNNWTFLRSFDMSSWHSKLLNTKSCLILFGMWNWHLQLLNNRTGCLLMRTMIMQMIMRKKIMLLREMKMLYKKIKWLPKRYWLHNYLKKKSKHTLNLLLRKEDNSKESKLEQKYLKTFADRFRSN